MHITIRNNSNKLKIEQAANDSLRKNRVCELTSSII